MFGCLWKDANRMEIRNKALHLGDISMCPTVIISKFNTIGRGRIYVNNIMWALHLENGSYNLSRRQGQGCVIRQRRRVGGQGEYI